MIESTLSDLESRAAALIDAATTPDALESVRVEFLGRKGALASIGKDMGKLTPDERAAVGKRLNALKQDLESRFDTRKATFDKAALDARLASEWLDLTRPAPGIRPIPPRGRIRRAEGSNRCIRRGSP